MFFIDILLLYEYVANTKLEQFIIFFCFFLIIKMQYFFDFTIDVTTGTD